MEDFAPTIIFVGAIAIVVLFLMNKSKSSRISELIDSKQIAENRFRVEVDGLNKDLQKMTSINREAVSRLARSAERQRGLLKLVEEQKIHFPWLATAFADYQEYLGKMDEASLKFKKRPAPKAAKQVKEATDRAREAERNFRLLKYRIDFLEKYFPWITDITGDSLEELLSSRAPEVTPNQSEKDHDPVRKMLSDQEYSALTQTERNQLALDRWQQNKKRNWEIGRMYERYIGYMYEEQKYKVEYFGAIAGFDDLGRDLIARKDGKISIVQCKYWAKEKVIHEKHIFQLFGSVVEFIARSNSKESTLPLFGTFSQLTDITPVFVTSTALSDRARDFASILGVKVREKVPLGKYPMIKCNISRQNNERVYHLPFDQQYDRTVIEPEQGELYAWTTAEADKKGFRRAYRWRPMAGD